LVFHYRSYFLDYDTGLYYLKSRFYDPYIHRFISPDKTMLRILGSDVELNENNNPAKINTQVNSYNLQNKKILAKEKQPIVYKGVPVIYFEDDILNSFSFGFIFINKSNRDEDTLKHEWGHTMQFLILGMGDYLNMIFLPSSISNLIDRNFSLPYYQLPWEVTADMMGGVVRDGTTLSHQILGLAYLAKAELISNAVVKPAILPAYSTAAGVVDLLVPGLGTLLFTWIYTS